jgi:predicted aminopeptidase
VPAYSTLGWTNWLGGDPLLDTFLDWPQADLARLIFHELAHQVAYAADDTQFNESFATAVERLGGQRWLQRHGSEALLRETELRDARREALRRLTRDARRDLEALYRAGGDADPLRQAKTARMARLRADYEDLKSRSWGGYAGHDPWFDKLNNASLGLQGTYDAWVPGFERLFDQQGRDFRRFHAEAARLARGSADQRRAALQP